MNTPLQSTGVVEGERTRLRREEAVEEHALEEGSHLHLPGPSYWPFVISVAILITFVGLLIIDSTPVLLIIGVVLVLISIIGWGLENPLAGETTEEKGYAQSFAEAALTGKLTLLAQLALGQAEDVVEGRAIENPPPHVAVTEVEEGGYAQSFAEAALTGKLTLLAQATLQQAEDVVEQTVTISSTAWSAHPVKVFVEREGVVLSLYGSVESEARKQEVEQALRKLPGVLDVLNFLVVQSEAPGSVKVFVEREGVVLSLYGKVELEAQKQEVENVLRQIPGVLDVLNFLVAEDELLNEVNRVIEKMKADGKLAGAANIYALVENYIVSLYGEVPDPKMKYALEREITAIPGARVVINHIGLNEDIPGELGKTSNRIGRI
jgi:osmotically-inducible protein OsmY